MNKQTIKNETDKNVKKRIYQAPVIQKIKLDNEISLVLQSGPPTGPDESYAPEYIKNDPFKVNLG